VRIINAMDGAGGLTQEPVPPGGAGFRFGSEKAAAAGASKMLAATA
jgi:hypothetical protein